MVLEVPRYIENQSSIEEEKIFDNFEANKRSRFHTKDKRDYSLLTVALIEDRHNGR